MCNGTVHFRSCPFAILSSFPASVASTIAPFPRLCYRDLAHPNRTESAGQQAEYAVQAVNKVVTALDAQSTYYPRPFAQYGIVLMLDNSHLAGGGDVVGARDYFQWTFEKSLDWSLLPNTFSAIWTTSDKKREYRGMRQPLTS